MKGALALCLALVACTGKTTPAAGPTGPYHYESTEGGVTIDSTLTVRYDPSAAVVDEDVRFGQVTANVENRLDPKTFSAITYVMRNDPEQIDPSISVSAAGASFKTKTRGNAVAKAPVPGAPAWVFGNYASSFVMLPSLVRATHPRNINAYMTSVFHGKAFAMKLSVIPPTEKRPSGIPPEDLAISLGSARRPMALVTVWYDPSTLVVDGVNIAGGTAFVRKPQ